MNFCLKTFLASTLAIVCCLAASNLSAQQTATANIENILSRKPSQPDVQYDSPTAEELARCESKLFKEGNYSGLAIYGPNGTLLRVACRKEDPAKPKETMVQEFRYFQNGVEVFRDLLAAGECRWLGVAGSRWGIRKEKSTEIDRWKQISPEETTAEAIAAIVANDEARYRRVAMTSEDLKTLGITGPLAEELGRQIESVAKFGELVQKLQIPADIRWGAFNGSHPALLPQGRSGLAVDLPIYFNSSVVLMNPKDASQSHQLYIGDLVRIGETWKIVGLPSGEPFGNAEGDVTVASTFFPAGSDGETSAVSQGSGDYSLFDTLTEAQKQLESAPDAEKAAACEKVFGVYMEMAAADPKERDNFVREGARFLLTEIQSGHYPKGAEQLAKLYEVYKEKENRDLAAFIRLQQILGEYFAAMHDPNAKDHERVKAEEDYRESLVTFADQFPRTAAAAEALMTLALDQEYIQDNDAAITYYSTVAKDFPQTPQGQKAAGALRRLGLTGQTLTLPKNWTLTNGQPATLVPGKRNLIFFWASWNLNPEDFALLKKVAAANTDLAITAVSLDGSKEEFEKAVSSLGTIPWPIVFVPAAEAGGDSPIATEFGVQVPPMAILLDENNKVLHSNILTMESLPVLLEGFSVKK